MMVHEAHPTIITKAVLPRVLHRCSHARINQLSLESLEHVTRESIERCVRCRQVRGDEHQLSRSTVEGRPEGVLSDHLHFPFRDRDEGCSQFSVRYLARNVVSPLVLAEHSMFPQVLSLKLLRHQGSPFAFFYLVSLVLHPDVFQAASSAPAYSHHRPSSTCSLLSSPSVAACFWFMKHQTGQSWTRTCKLVCRL